jgi:hypothetical protein
MLLGQLFHYIKVIDKITLPINETNFSEIDLAGVGSLNFEEYKNLSQAELQRKLRDVFSSFYIKYLEENKLDFAANFWKGLTSPTKFKSKKLNPSSDFQRQLLNWQSKDFVLSEFKNVVESGRIATDEQDVAIYYGLKVIQKLSENLEDKIVEFDSDLETDSTEGLKKEPQILIITESHKAPLFININCLFSPLQKSTDLKETLDEIQSDIEQNPSISLVLIDLEDSQKIINYLQKHLPSNILVTSLGLTEIENMKNQTKNNNQTFFDKVVKQTLGVRLN